MYNQTLTFLNELAQNNHKPWFDANRPRYEALRTHFLDQIEIIYKSIAHIDEDLHGLEPRKCVFRINRDVRFSKDKSPYKPYFSAFLAKDGKKSLEAGYYLHLQANNGSFVAGGIWQPESTQLAKIRQEIDYNGNDLIQILNKKTFATLFAKIEGETLVNPPKGYLAQNPYIELIKHKSFVVTHAISDHDIENGLFNATVENCFREQLPFNDFLRRATK